MFSRRTEWDTEVSELAQAYQARAKRDLPIADLTASNPTRCGFAYPADLLQPLAGEHAFDYDPNPKGSVRAREAVCRYYAELGAEVSPEQIILTTSTSEAYSYLFKLLCDPGDVVLAPQPSYPLFDFLARAECVELAATPLIYDYGWQLDVESLRMRMDNRTRALVLVHPNNPTGHFTKQAEAEEIAELCREHRLALIVDEVFLDYHLGDGAPKDLADRATFLARELGVTTFVVSGISKICGLPQMKAAWIAAAGPESRTAIERLEVVADTFLSMNAPVQQALPVWLAQRGVIQRQIRERVSGNLAALDRLLANREGSSASRLRVEGGWYAVLRIPATQPDEVTARELLDRGVWAHPGHFFGMPEAGWLVLSLLARPEEFSSGVEALRGYLSERHR